MMIGDGVGRLGVVSAVVLALIAPARATAADLAGNGCFTMTEVVSQTSGGSYHTSVTDTVAATCHPGDPPGTIYNSVTTVDSHGDQSFKTVTQYPSGGPISGYSESTTNPDGSVTTTSRITNSLGQTTTTTATTTPGTTAVKRRPATATTVR
ncbi:MAG TPA: hypothetical protein VMT68_16950 [Caulobacteraceae bacterium]|nr:hypothetical protein [Caulobacteraceae bacterium]